MADKWLGTSVEQALLVVLSGAAIYTVVLLYTRIAGLRSFAQLSAFDFAMTVAVGSIMATTAASPSTTLANGALALAVLYVMQVSVALARRRTTLNRLVDNQPTLLLLHGRPISEHLAAVRFTEGDLRAKVRLSGLTGLDEVAAIVLETTGDLAVVPVSDRALDPELFAGVRGVERLRRE